MGLIAKLHTDGKPGLAFAGFLGTSKAWVEFVGWADRLDASKFELVGHLAEHNYQTDLPGLESNLGDAMKVEPPKGPAGQVAKAVLAVLKDRGNAGMIVVADETAEV